MTEEDITTVEELAEFMTAQAILWRREDSELKAVNGAGIRKQWHERINFPYSILYVVGKEGEAGDSPFQMADDRPHVNFEMKSMWFTEDGDVTERPKP